MNANAGVLGEYTIPQSILSLLSLSSAKQVNAEEHPDEVDMIDESMFAISPVSNQTLRVTSCGSVPALVYSYQYICALRDSPHPYCTKLITSRVSSQSFITAATLFNTTIFPRLLRRYDDTPLVPLRSTVPKETKCR